MCGGLVRSYLLIDLTLCIKDDVDYIYRIAGNFHMVQIFTFLRGTLVNANKISTKELENLEMALHRLWISALRKLRTFDAPCISTNSKRIAKEIVFVVFF